MHIWSSARKPCCSLLALKDEIKVYVFNSLRKYPEPTTLPLNFEDIESVAHIFPLDTTHQQPTASGHDSNAMVTAETSSVHPPGPFYRPPSHSLPPPIPSAEPILSHPTLKGHARQNSNPTSAERRTPASYHKIYTSHDITGTFPTDYALVLDIAARWVGTGREDVGTIVGKLEKRATMWWKAKKRRMRGMERRDVSGEDRAEEGDEEDEWSDSVDNNVTEDVSD